jgi:hypothetical protein
VCQLKEQVMDHVHSGCQIMVSAHFWTEDSPGWNPAICMCVCMKHEYTCLCLYGFGFWGNLRCNGKSKAARDLCINLYIGPYSFIKLWNLFWKYALMWKGPWHAQYWNVCGIFAWKTFIFTANVMVLERMTGPSAGKIFGAWREAR